jgi:hypothetical protein
MVPEVSASVHPDVKQAHHWARISFVLPDSVRELDRVEVRVSTSPIVIDLTGLEAGDTVAAEIGQLMPETHYFVAVRGIDECNDPGTISVAEVTTREIHFTTVSPCFVATAAYGTPMAEEIRALRRFRDRHLRSNAAGRALVSVYESVGPDLAAVIREDEQLRAAARILLAPAVALAGALD